MGVQTDKDFFVDLSQMIKGWIEKREKDGGKRTYTAETLAYEIQELLKQRELNSFIEDEF